MQPAQDIYGDWRASGEIEGTTPAILQGEEIPYRAPFAGVSIRIPSRQWHPCYYEKLTHSHFLCHGQLPRPMHSGDRQDGEVYAERILRKGFTHLVSKKESSGNHDQELTNVIFQEWNGPTLISIPTLTTRSFVS